MIFAISMDYTVFLLSSAKEHWDRSHDAREAAIGGIAHSGRVIFAAAAVMVAVFFTFALSGPLPRRRWASSSGWPSSSTQRSSGSSSSRHCCASSAGAPGRYRAGLTACFPTSGSDTANDSATRRWCTNETTLAARTNPLLTRRTMTLLAVLLSATVSPWFLLLAAFVGLNQLLYVATGAAPPRSYSPCHRARPAWCRR